MSGHPAAQIAARPGATTVAVGLGTAQDHRCQCRFLPLSQPSLRPTLGAIAQPGQILGVVAHHRIAQCLALHPGQPRRFGPARPVKRVGDGVKPCRNPAFGFPPRQPTQLARRSIIPDFER
jgi:hypothetical protein